MVLYLLLPYCVPLDPTPSVRPVGVVERVPVVDSGGRPGVGPSGYPVDRSPELSVPSIVLTASGE